MKPNSAHERYIGLISGTSRDGLDAVLVEFEQGNPAPLLLNARCTPYPETLRDSVDQLIHLGRAPGPLETRQVDRNLGHFFARACNDLIRDSGFENRDITAIGSHGQTVWHAPDEPKPVTVQLGNPFVMANITRIQVVADFRTADLSAGGQGAPLAPLFHRQLLRQLTTDSSVAVLNLGGIANLTLLGNDDAVSGHDTGPANCLMDAWINRHQSKPFDNDGHWADSGTVLPELLQQLLTEPYFSATPPKSTGLELFNLDWLDRQIETVDNHFQPADVQRTLLALTVETIARDVEQAGPAQAVMVCGGGVHNALLMQELQSRLPDHTLGSTADVGVHPDWVEACLFAWLARENLLGREQNTPPITGARHPVMLGQVSLP